MTVKWIAEISSNHNKDLSRTIKLIRKAAEIGCWAVKFQYFKADKLYFPTFKNKINQMKKWELPESFLPEIESYCNDLNIKFICSVFNSKGVNTVKDYVDFLKIGSYELLNYNLVKTVITTKQQWIVSAGMERVDIGEMFLKNIRISETLGRYNNPLYAILHCNSNYPAKPENCNLKSITILKNYFRSIPIGWSDHTVEPGVIYKAIAFGAEIIEFHMDLEDGKGVEYPIGHCWKPRQIEEVIRNVRIGEEACQAVNPDKDNEIRKWRMDIDGFRPLKKHRKELLKNELGK